MDYDKTCIETLLGEEKVVDKILVTLHLFSRSQWHIECPKHAFHALSSELEDGFCSHRYIIGWRERVG